MSLAIFGIGTATPEHSMEQPQAAALAGTLRCQAAGQTRLLPALYRRTGVHRRHSVILESSTNGTPARQSFYQRADSDSDRGPTTTSRMIRYESDAGPLALAACRAALADANVVPNAVTHLITVSCSGFSAPGVDIGLIRDLGLPSTVARTHIGFMGCHGALNGLRVAHAIAEADASACVLLCAVELCSLHQHYGSSPDKIVANALFADGAAAIVGRRQSETEGNGWSLVASGSMVVPDSEELMRWQIRDHGLDDLSYPGFPR